MMLRTLRRRLAALLLGDDVVMFAPKSVFERMECGDYLSLSDNELGVATRRWFLAIEDVHRKKADAEDRPVSTMIAQHSVLAIANYADSVNAETANFTVRGSIDGGKTEGVFRLDFYRLSDDYNFDGPRVEKVTSPDDPDKITSLTLRFDIPNYDRWKAERGLVRSTGSAGRQASPK